ncbi:RNA polymerase sigma factor [Nocardia cyriacigeorgica]|uniref:RNA polymerase sigma factor n=1 Tax=Nocardia cyriacigeorgica TaxID=135487 RepID=UPI00189436D4|nr:sigma-70 family RNA polymerase sigma factor [Nocardia cyriacigeorgica]MBF6412831.1 sigma-70 family RNA polymerase sigma factor [Nocardia cyriacigeorgica]
MPHRSIEGRPGVERGWAGEQLVAAAQRGDPEAISAIVDGAHPHVRRFAQHLCASTADAEDAAQEALIILYRKIGTLRAATAIASWMFRIVRNECLRRARRLLDREHDGAVIIETVVSAEDEVLRRLDTEQLARAIAELPPLQRRVLIMRDVLGHSGRETADALGLSTAAMKSQLHRARAAVRHDLADLM